MLIKVGWKKDSTEKNTPVLPISGWMRDKSLEESENMAWWRGTEVFVGSEEFHGHPSRPLNTSMHTPISDIYKIKGVGDMLVGRVEKGIVKPGNDPIRASEKSLWKCTISELTRLVQVTTWA